MNFYHEGLSRDFYHEDLSRDFFSIFDLSYSSENFATMTVTGSARTIRPAKRASVPNTIPRGVLGYMSP